MLAALAPASDRCGAAEAPCAGLDPSHACPHYLDRARRCMGKAFRNFCRERAKFSPKKKRTSIFPSDVDGIMICPLHDQKRNRACIRKGCAVYEAKEAAQAGARATAPPAAPPVPSALSLLYSASIDALEN